MFSLPVASDILNDAGVDLSRKQDVFPQSPYAFSRARITSSIIMPKPAAKHKIFATRRGSRLYLDGSVTPGAIAHPNAEMIRHHKDDSEVPVPFSTFLENFGSDPSVLDVPIIEKPAPSLQDLHRHSVDKKSPISVSGGERRRSSGSSLDLSQRPTLHSIQPSMDIPSTRSSFLSAYSQLTSVTLQPSTSPFRHNFPLDPSDSDNHSRTLSAATTRSALISSLNAKSAMHKTALHPFQALLPDELDVRVGDKLSLLQIFDDGWCVCVAENHPVSTSNNEDMMMGCVPLRVFERAPKGQEDTAHMREVRTTSLAVTVENKPRFVSWNGTNTVSWSIF